MLIHIMAWQRLIYANWKQGKSAAGFPWCFHTWQNGMVGVSMRDSPEWALRMRGKQRLLTSFLFCSLLVFWSWRFAICQTRAHVKGSGANVLLCFYAAKHSSSCVYLPRLWSFLSRIWCRKKCPRSRANKLFVLVYKPGFFSHFYPFGNFLRLCVCLYAYFNGKQEMIYIILISSFFFSFFTFT